VRQRLFTVLLLLLLAAAARAQGGAPQITHSSVNGAGGAAALTTSALPAGIYAVTAEYGGDADFNPSSGALSGSQSVGSLFEFSQGLYSAAERAGSVSVIGRVGEELRRARQ